VHARGARGSAGHVRGRGPYVFKGKGDDGKTWYGIGEFVSIWIRQARASS
jgi:hypothetical protein